MSLESTLDRLRLLAESSHAFAEASNHIDTLLPMVAEWIAEAVGESCFLVASDGVALARFPLEAQDPRPRVEDGISGHVMAVPLRSRGQTLGSVRLARTAGPPYTELDLRLLRDLADRAALAIDNARLIAELEARLATRTAQLEATSKEIDAFSYSVSHDLRAPLRAIDGYSEILEEDHSPHLDDEGRRVIGVIRKNARRMGELIDDLLTFSRLGRKELTKATVPMKKLVDSLSWDATNAAKGRQIAVSIGDLPTAEGDYELLRQVWVNLLDNAVKYTRSRAEARIEVRGWLEDGEARYTVQDNGVGFDPRYASRLFGIFQRLHGPSEFDGTGMGLALVQRIVTRHGGRVWAQGGVDEGASFGFSLPVSDPPPRTPDA